MREVDRLRVNAKALPQNRATRSLGLGMAVALAVAICGCGGGAPSEPEFKGLRLGMPIEEAAAVMAKHGMAADTDKDGGVRYATLSRAKRKMASRMGAGGIIEVWKIYADESGGVDEIYLHGDGVNALFNAGDMSAEEFAQSFVDAYGIPEMEIYAHDVDPALIGLVGAAFTTGWAYADRENGWAVTISEDKQLTMKKVAAAAETKFD